MRGTQRLCSSRFLLQLCSCFSSVLAPALFLLQLCSSRFLLQPSRCPSLPPPFFAAALVGRQFVPSPSPLPRRPLASLLSLCPGVAADAWRSLALRCRLLSYSCWAGCGCECVFASAVQYILLHTRMQVSRLNCAFIFVKDAGGGVAEGGAGGDGGRGYRVLTLILPCSSQLSQIPCDFWTSATVSMRHLCEERELRSDELKFVSFVSRRCRFAPSFLKPASPYPSPCR